MKFIIRHIILIQFFVIALGCQNQNEPPIIQSLNANPPSVNINKTTRLTCLAIDPDSKDLSYSWSSINGTFPDGNSESSVIWNAPNKPGKYIKTVTVSDGKNTSTQTITIDVLQSAVVNGHVYFSGTFIPISGVIIQIGEEQYTTNTSGKFTFEAGIGAINLKASKDGFISYVGNIIIEELNDEIKIELTSELFSKKIFGVVKNSYDLNPVEGVQIIVLNPDGNDSELLATTSSNGNYEILNVPQGNRTIKIEHPDYRKIQHDLIINNSDINFDINLNCNPPTIENLSNNLVGLDSVNLKIKINSNCNQKFTAGFCFSENSNPTIDDNVIELSNETGNFEKVITDTFIEPLKTFYYKAFIQTEYEVIYGEQFTFILGILVDDRNNETRNYITVKIGDQVWMAENMAYLPKISQPTQNSETEPNYYVYAYSGTDVNQAKASYNYRIFGVLYNWPAAKDACPPGWHLPTYDDWEKLAQYISDQNGGYSKKSNYWINVGEHLKATNYWFNNRNGIDDFGFSGLPGGYCNFNGDFFSIEKAGYWWSYDESSATNAWCRYLNFNTTSIYRSNTGKKFGFSVRCVKD